jgi:glycosyltransferase involved in cell wall biosynthesis
MKISVITCTWNSMTYLEQSIKSVLSQDFKNIEYIFVDGGSTDGTLERIAKVKGDVKILYNVRGGIANAMNKGIEVATGDIIAHMHSDDYYLGPDVFTKVLNTFERTNCHWLFGRVMSDIEGSLIKERYTVPSYSYAKLLKRNIIPHAATFVHRDVFAKFRLFDESYRLAMDYEMWLRIGKTFTPTQLDDYLAAFRRHPGSATESNRLRSLNEDFRARFYHGALINYPEYALRYLIRRYRLQRELAI